MFGNVKAISRDKPLLLSNQLLPLTLNLSRLLKLRSTDRISCSQFIVFSPSLYVFVSYFVSQLNFIADLRRNKLTCGSDISQSKIILSLFSDSILSLLSYFWIFFSLSLFLSFSVMGLLLSFLLNQK